MLKKFAITAIGALSFAGFPAAFAVTGMFIDGNLGYVDHEDESGTLSDAFGQSAGSSQDHLGWMLSTGYSYEMDSRFDVGAEFGYADYNKINYNDSFGSSAKNEQSAWLMLGNATWHINPLFDLIAKAGAGYGYSKASLKTGDYSMSDSDREWVAVASLGAGWNILPELNIHASWDHVFEHDTFNKVDAFWIGLKYTFTNI